MGLSLYDIDKISYDNITFSMSQNDYKTITKSKHLKYYKLEVVDKDKSLSSFTKMFARIGVVIGLFVSVVGCVMFGRLTLHYNIYGLNSVDRKVVESALEEYGIKLGRVNKFKNSDLENYLLQNIEGLSLVSVMKKGTTICINLKEKDDILSKKHTDLISPYNMIIKSINVTSGTSLYNAGDIVLAGKTLVGAYMQSPQSGTCVVTCSVKGEAWWVGSVRFDKRTEVLIPTGRKKMYRQIVFGNRGVEKQKIKSPYNVQKMSQCVSGYLSNFLPIRFITTTYYECEKQVVWQNLDENKQILLQESRLLAYNKVPANIVVSGEEQKIIDMGDYYLISTYLTAEVEVKSAN